MMKMKAIALILCIVLCFSIMVGCAKKPCDPHVDANKDAKCDVCEAAVPCTTHADSDKNRKCDVCQADVEPNCDLHMDADKNLVCDKCGYTIDPPCTHKDENADNVCDLCTKAIVVIFQPAEKEEHNRVQMVVSVPPTGVALDAYLKTAYEKEPVLQTITKLEAGERIGDRYFLSTVIDPVPTVEIPASPEYTKVHYTVKDALANKTVLTYTARYGTTVDIVESSGLIFVVVDSVNNYGLCDTITAYSVNGQNEMVFSYDATSVEAFFAQSTVAGQIFPSVNGMTYVRYGDKYVFIDNESKNVVAKDLDARTFVLPPVFDSMNDKYGYIEEDGELFIYDSTKILDCVYSYEPNAYYEDGKYFFLDNGNVLYQALVMLEQDAVSYDIIAGGDKYDIVYVLIDPAAKTATNIEFGYYIAKISAPDESWPFNSKAVNVATVYEIVNDRIDTSSVKTFVLDGTMKILYDANQVFSDKYDKIVAIKNGYYLAASQLGGEYTFELLDTAGNRVSYLNANECKIVLGGNCIYYGGALYDISLNRLVERYSIVPGSLAYIDQFVILYEDIASVVEGVDVTTRNYYYYNGVGEPALINTQGGEISFVDDIGYKVVYQTTVSVPVTETTESETTEGETTAGVITEIKNIYEYYNADNKLIVSTDIPLVETLVHIEDNNYFIADVEGNVYLIK